MQKKKRDAGVVQSIKHPTFELSSGLDLRDVSFQLKERARERERGKKKVYGGKENKGQ